MTLADLSSIASMISGLAVLVSLVYLGLQTRQNIRHTRGLIQRGRADLTVENTRSWADGLMACVAGAPDVTEKDLMRFSLMTRAAFLYWEDGYLQNRQGLLTGEAFESFEAQIRANLPVPGIRAAWNLHRRSFSSGLQKYIDGIIAQTPAVSMVSRSDAWKAAVAEVNSAAPA